MTNEDIATEIEIAWKSWSMAFARQWMPMRLVADFAGLTTEELARGVRHLARTDERCLIEQEADQGSLTELDKAMGPVVGGERKDLICWV